LFEVAKTNGAEEELVLGSLWIWSLISYANNSLTTSSAKGRKGYDAKLKHINFQNHYTRS